MGSKQCCFSFFFFESLFFIWGEGEGEGERESERVRAHEYVSQGGERESQAISCQRGARHTGLDLTNYETLNRPRPQAPPCNVVFHWVSGRDGIAQFQSTYHCVGSSKSNAFFKGQKNNLIFFLKRNKRIALRTKI